MAESANAISVVSMARPRSEVKTASILSSRLLWPNSAASCLPLPDSLPGSQPVAIPRSLSTGQRMGLENNFNTHDNLYLKYRVIL